MKRITNKVPMTRSDAQCGLRGCVNTADRRPGQGLVAWVAGQLQNMLQLCKLMQASRCLGPSWGGGRIRGGFQAQACEPQGVGACTRL